MKSFSGPWAKTNYHKLPPHQQIARELNDFVEWIEPTPDEKRMRLFTIVKYSKFIETFFTNYYDQNQIKSKISVVPQGSSVANCFLPNSDIDLIVIGLSDTVDVSDALGKLVKQFWRFKLISSAIILRHAKVPIAKIVDKEFDFHIDIGIGHINGAFNIPRVLNYFSKFPLLKPVLLFMKAFLFINKLDDPSKGGFGSNHIMLLILFVLMQNPQISTEEQLLIRVLTFIAEEMNIFLTALTTLNGSCYLSKFNMPFESKIPQSIICQDPQFPDNYYGIRSKQSLELISICQRAMNEIQQNLNPTNSNSTVYCIDPDDSADTDDNFEPIVSFQFSHSESSIITRILNGYETITYGREEFQEMAQKWKLPARKFAKIMDNKITVVKSRSAPNLNKDVNHIKNERKHLIHLDLDTNRNQSIIYNPNQRKINQNNEPKKKPERNTPRNKSANLNRNKRNKKLPYRR